MDSDSKEVQAEKERWKRSIIPLVYEPPCEHLPLFDTCLAKVTIFKSKLCSDLAAAVNMDSESHKIAFVEVLGDSGDCKYKDEETSQLEFVLELNFGLKSMLSSTPYMRCLKCAGFSKEEWNLNMIACSPTYLICINYSFLDHAAHNYVEKIQFWQLRRCK